MKIIETLFNKLGYVKKHKPFTSKYFIDGTPYCKNDIWYNFYDYITASDEQKDELNEYWELYFRMAPSEIARLKKFIEVHKHKELDSHADPKIWVGFGSGGGIGKCVYVKCDDCNGIYDITDNSVW